MVALRGKLRKLERQVASRRVPDRPDIRVTINGEPLGWSGLRDESAKEVLEIDLPLRPKQVEVFRAPHPELLFSGGLGMGKSYVGARWSPLQCLRRPSHLHLATANSDRQLFDAVAASVIGACEEMGIPWVFQKGRRVILIGWHRTELHLRTTDALSIQRLRSIEFASWWGEEMRDTPAESVEVIVGRLRIPGVAPQDIPKLWTTTPRGKDHCHRRFVKRVKERPHLRKVRKWVQGTTYDNPDLREYAEGLKEDYDELLYRQEVLGEIVDIKGEVPYYAFSEEENVSDRVRYWDDLPLIMAHDYGPACHAVAGQLVGDEVHWIREFKNVDLYELAKEVREAFPGHRHTWRIFGDWTSASQRAGTGGATWGDLTEEAYEQALGSLEMVEFHLSGANPAVVDRVACTNRMFRNAEGRRRQFAHPRCKGLIRDWDEGKWVKGGGKLDKGPKGGLTHFSDGPGYYCWAEHRSPHVFDSEAGYGISEDRAA